MDDWEKSATIWAVLAYNGLTLRCWAPSITKGYDQAPEDNLTCWTLRFTVDRTKLEGPLILNALTDDGDFIEFVRRRLSKNGRTIIRRTGSEAGNWTVRSQCHVSWSKAEKGQIIFEWGFWAVPATSEDIAREEIRRIKEGVS